MAKPLRKFSELNKKLYAAVQGIYGVKKEFHGQMREGKPKIRMEDFEEKIAQAEDVLDEIRKEWKAYFAKAVFTGKKKDKDEPKKKKKREEEPEPPKRKARK